MLRLCEEQGQQLPALRAHYLRICDLLEQGDIEDVDREIRTYTAVADQMRQRHTGNVEIVAAMRATIDGRFDDAEAMALEALRLASSGMDPARAAQTYATQLSLIRREQGRLGELEPVIKSFVEQFPALNFPRVGLAFTYSQLGRRDEAAAEFERLAANDFTRIPRNVAWMGSMALMSETCAWLGDQDRAAVLYGLLLPYAARRASLDFWVCYGPVAYHLGLLAAAMGRVDDAAQHFEAALEHAAKARSRSWMARTQYAYAAMLLGRNTGNDAVQARALIDKAGMIAHALKMTRLLEELESLRAASAPSVEPAEVAAQASSPHECLFRREGDYWTIGFDGNVTRLHHAKGLSCLAVLLANPGRQFYASDVEGGPDSAATSGGTRRDDSTQGESPTLGDAGEMLDPAAKAAYKRRLNDLREELEEARERNDEGRIEKAEEEIEFLDAELRRALGLGGRDRKAASHGERARVRVTKLIKTAVARISESNPALGSHLAATVRTGTLCAYTPDPRTSIRWSF